MKKYVLTVLAVAILLCVSSLQAYACEYDNNPQDKGHSSKGAAGYFASEFNKYAPVPVLDLESEPTIWFYTAHEQGWVVKLAAKDAKLGALILGYDKSNALWIGIVRGISDGIITFGTLDANGQEIKNSVDPSTLQHEYRLIGYIWPQRVNDKVKEISMDKASEAWQSKEALFIDVRAVDKYKQGHIPGAISIPLTELKSRLKEIPKKQMVLLICKSGQGSSQANIILQSYGFTNTESITGGMLGWRGVIEK